MKKLLLITVVLISLSLVYLNANFKSEALIQPQGYGVGDVVEGFDLADMYGNTVSLPFSNDVEGYIVIFSCNHCPFVVANEDRMIDLHNNYGSQFPVIAINSNSETHPDDTVEKMQARAQEKGFEFSYLVDADQTIAKRFGAQKTPHVYLLDKNMKIRYIGAIDDNVKDATAVTEKYVENAMNQILNGEKVTKTEAKAVGCTIKWAE